MNKISILQIISFTFNTNTSYSKQNIVSPLEVLIVGAGVLSFSIGQKHLIFKSAKHMFLFNICQ